MSTPHLMKFPENILLFDRGLRRCGCCEKIKNLSEYGNNKNYKDGKQTWCKECKNKDLVAYNSVPKNRIKANESARKSMAKKRKRIAEENQLVDSIMDIINTAHSAPKPLSYGGAK